MCGWCGAPVLIDDSPGVIVPYTCPNCGATDSNTDQRAASRQQVIEKQLVRKKAVLEQRAKNGLPAIWVEERKTTAKQRAQARKDGQTDKRAILNLLSKDSNPPPRGRKPDPAYDKAAFRIKLAELGGKTITVNDLAEFVLPADKSSREYKRDKVKQAIKRRAKNR
jgi:hypothetical protein